MALFSRPRGISMSNKLISTKKHVPAHNPLMYKLFTMRRYCFLNLTRYNKSILLKQHPELQFRTNVVR